MNPTQLFIDDINQIWEPDRFTLQRQPVPVGAVDVDPDVFARPLPSALDMLVKTPGQDQFTLPEPFAQHQGLVRALELIRAFEIEHAPDQHHNYYAYLTVDNRIVKAAKTHRNAGWHFDGMQGARYQDKLPVCHQYIVADTLPTEFSDQPLDATGLDELCHNWFRVLGSQIDPACPLWHPQPLEIVAMSAYQMHRAAISDKDQRRMFIRLDYSLKQQDRLGNTVNPDLPAPWPMVDRPLPEGLMDAVDDTGWAGDGDQQF